MASGAKGSAVGEYQLTEDQIMEFKECVQTHPHTLTHTWSKFCRPMCPGLQNLLRVPTPSFFNPPTHRAFALFDKDGDGEQAQAQRLGRSRMFESWKAQAQAVAPQAQAVASCQSLRVSVVHCVVC